VHAVLPNGARYPLTRVYGAASCGATGGLTYLAGGQEIGMCEQTCATLGGADQLEVVRRCE
jgi:hypothetical protein